MPAAMTNTGRAVAFMPTANPAIMLVPCPVVLAVAMALTGLYLPEVKYSVITTIKPVTAMPTSDAKNKFTAEKGTSNKPPIIFWVTYQKPIAAKTALTARPKYRGLIKFLVLLEARTVIEPIILA